MPIPKHRTSEIDQAYVACLERVRSEPGDSRSHLLLALALWLRGEGEQALLCARAAQVLRPDDPDGMCHQAQMRAARGDLAQALLLFRRALYCRPGDAEVLYRMGVALAERKEMTGAAGSYLLALVCRPDHGEALNNLGVITKNMGNLDRAIRLFVRAFDVLPFYAPAQNNLGLALVAQGRIEEGDDHYRRALVLEPTHPDAVNNRGVVESLSGDFERAVLWCRRALHLRPDYPAAFNNLGNALKDLGALQEAIEAYDSAIALGNSADHRHNRALAVLATGNLREGWAQYEERWDSAQLRAGVREFVKPRWKGEAGQGQTLLLHAEQGFGDSLQFCRYAPLAAARGWRVVVEVPQPLVRLMGSLDGVAQVVASGGPLPDFDMQCPMMSLPYAFGTELDSIPAPHSYLSADTGDSLRWEQRLASLGPGLRVGLVWAGNARRHSPDLNATDRRRSMASALLAPLAAIPGITLVSLQKDGVAPFAAADWMGECRDFADSAALVAGLDLVIGVDTAVIHLAAALGKPVWMLNRFDSCWRWLREGETSPWYPGLRIFRQPRPGDWRPVVEQVAAGLRRITATTDCA